MPRGFGYHLWKSMRDVEEWVEVVEGVKIKVVRPERPEEYHKRPPDRLTICLFGWCFTVRLPQPVLKVSMKALSPERRARG